MATEVEEVAKHEHLSHLGRSFSQGSEVDAIGVKTRRRREKQRRGERGWRGWRRRRKESASAIRNLHPFYALDVSPPFLSLCLLQNSLRKKEKETGRGRKR